MEPTISHCPCSRFAASTKPVPALWLRLGSSRPEIGSQGSNTPNNRMNIRPHRKSGIDCTMAARLSISDDDQRPWYAADSTPAAPPSTQASSMATRPSSSVAGRRSLTNNITSCRNVMEVPKRPLATSRNQITNCSAIPRSRPYKARSRVMSSALAPGGIIIAIGSPGTTRISTNTTSPTPKSVGRASSRRRNRTSGFMAAQIPFALSPSAQLRTGLLTDPGGPLQGLGSGFDPSTGSGRARLSPNGLVRGEIGGWLRAQQGARLRLLHCLRQYKTCTVGGCAQSLAKHHGLVVLEQRYHVGVLGDVLAGFLVTGDTLGFVLFAP